MSLSQAILIFVVLAPGVRVCGICVAVAAWLDPERTLPVLDYRADILRLAPLELRHSFGRSRLGQTLRSPSATGLRSETTIFRWY